MDHNSNLRDRLIELAEAELTVAALVELAEGDFALRFDSGVDVEVENLTDTGHAALSTVIGTPASPVTPAGLRGDADLRDAVARQWRRPHGAHRAQGR